MGQSRHGEKQRAIWYQKSMPKLPLIRDGSSDMPHLHAIVSYSAGGAVAAGFSCVFFRNSILFNLSARPTGWTGFSASALCTFPSPPRPVWKSWFSVLGRRAASGIAMLSLRLVAAIPGEPMFAAPPRPVEYGPSPWSPTTPSRTISPSV